MYTNRDDHEQDRTKHQDIYIIDKRVVADRDNKNADHILYHLLLSSDDYPGEWEEYVQVVKLIRLHQVPKEIREKKTLMDIHTDIMQAVWRSDIYFLAIACNIKEPRHLGLVFCYGIKVVEPVSDELEPELARTLAYQKARERAETDYLTILGTLKGSYRQCMFRQLTLPEAGCLRAAMEQATDLAIMRGVPKVRNGAGQGTNKSLTGLDSSPDSMEQNEELMRGLIALNEPFVMVLLATPIEFGEIEYQAVHVARELGKYKSQASRNKGFSGGLSFPMVFNGSLGSTLGTTSGMSNTDSSNQTVSQGESSTQTHGFSLGEGVSSSHGFSQGENTGVANSENQTLSHGVGKAYSNTETTGTAETQSQSSSVTDGRTVGQTVSHGTTSSYGVNTSQAYGTNESNSTNQSVSKGIGYSTGTSQTYGQNYSVSDGTSSSTSHGVSSGVSNSNSISNSLGQSTNQSISNSQSSSESASYGGSSSLGSSWGNSSNHSNSTNNGTSLGAQAGLGFFGSNVGMSTGSGESDGYGSSQGGSSSNGNSWSNSAGFSQGTTISNGIGSSQSTTQGSSHGTSSGVSDSYSQGNSHSVSQGQSYSQGTTQTQSQNLSNTSGIGHSMGVSNTNSTGVSRGFSESNTIANSVSQSHSVSESRGISHAQSQSTSIGQTTNESDSIGKGRGQTASKGYNLGETIGTGNTANVSQTQSAAKGATIGRSEGTGQSIGRSEGISNAQSIGSGASMAIGPNIGYNESWTQYDFIKENLATVLANQNMRYQKALKNGLFYTDVYFMCRSAAVTRIIGGLATSSFGGNEEVSPVQVISPPEEEVQHLLRHATAFIGCTKREVIPGIAESYRYSSVLLPKETAAICALPRVEGGGFFTVAENIPAFTVLADKQGEIKLGKQINFETGLPDLDYHISKGELMHILLPGASGSGKTTTAKKIVKDICQHKNFEDFKILALDWKKSWRVIKRFVRKEDFSLYTLDIKGVNRFKTNLYVPPLGIDVQTWAERVTESICLAFGFGTKQSAILSTTITRLFIDRRVLVPNADNIPIEAPDAYDKVHQIGLDDVYYEINKLKIQAAGTPAMRNQLDSYESILLKLAKFYTTELRSMYCCKDKNEIIHIQDLINGRRCIVLEGGDLDDSIKKCVINYLANGIFLYCKSQYFLTGHAEKRLFLLEEAHRVISSADGGDTPPLGVTEDIYNIMYNEAREYGLYMMCLVQSPSHLPRNIIANTGIIILHRLSNKEDVEPVTLLISKNGRLDHRDVPLFITKLPVGWCIISIKNQREHQMSDAVLVQTKYESAQPPEDEEIIIDYNLKTIQNTLSQHTEDSQSYQLLHEHLGDITFVKDQIYTLEQEIFASELS